MELFSLSETIKGGTTETAAIFAGTGSEVKLDGKLPPPHRYNPRKVAVAPQVTFSERKIEEMKRLAHFLSQRVATANRTDKAGCSRDQCTVGSMEGSSMESCSIYGPDGNLLQGISLGPDTLKMEVVDENTVVHEKEKDCDCSCKSITDIEQLGTDNGNLATLPSDNWKELASHSSKDEESINNDVSTCNTVSEEISCHLNPNNDNCNSNLVEPGVSKTCSPGKEFSPQKEVGRVKRSKKRRSSELEMVEEFAEFEGQKVPHLVKWKVDKGGKKRKKNRQEKGEQGNRKCDIAKQEYMSQDDYVLHKLFSKTGIETAMRHDTIMEGGPNDYAIVEAEADRVAQDAVRALRESRAQVPTFRRATFKFSLKKKLLNDKQDSTERLMEVIKKRELNLDSSVTEKSLLGEVVTWLNNQGGTASTAQLVEQFSPKVGTGQSPLFKSLLKNIATFYRAPDNIGYWTIKDEFK